MKEILFGNQEVSASEKSMEAARKSREAVERIVSESKVVFGITTGFGKLSDVLINKIKEILHINILVKIK